MHEEDEAKTQNEKKDTKRGTLERRKMSMRNLQQGPPAIPQRENAAEQPTRSQNRSTCSWRPDRKKRKNA